MTIDENSESDSSSAETFHASKKTSKMAFMENAENNENSKMANMELYKYTDKGPFYVISKSKNLDEFHLCELMMKFKAKDIIDVTKITKVKARIHAKSYTAANNVINMGKIKAFERYKYIFTDGVVKEIPVYYNEQQLNDMIDCKVPIVNITRMTYWNRIAQPSTFIKVTFRAATVPENVSFM